MIPPTLSGAGGRAQHPLQRQVPSLQALCLSRAMSSPSLKEEMEVYGGPFFIDNLCPPLEELPGEPVRLERLVLARPRIPSQFYGSKLLQICRDRARRTSNRVVVLQTGRCTFPRRLFRAYQTRDSCFLTQTFKFLHVRRSKAAAFRPGSLLRFTLRLLAPCLGGLLFDHTHFDTWQSGQTA